MPRLRSLRLALMAGALAGASGPALAQPARDVFLPIAFHVDGRPVRTTACLQVSERAYGAGAWWREPARETTAAEQALRSVLDAIARQDRAAFARLTDPVQAARSAELNRQADAYFRQFAVLRIAAIPLAYELDGLTVFFARIAGTGREFFAAFVFAAHADGGWRFLPSQPDRPAYVLLRGWFDASWGPAHADIPTYCGSDLVARATHTASLGGWPGTLWLRGAAIDGAATDPAATGARAAVEQLKQAGAAGADGVSNLSARMTPQGSARFSRWLAAATPGDRAAYTGQFAALRPFFVFDASPLLVVYARTAAGRIEVLYFTRSEQGDLLWANASQMSSVDRAFKRDPLYAAANAETPFGPLAIRRDAR